MIRIERSDFNHRGVSDGFSIDVVARAKMPNNKPTIVAGHICLDIIPSLANIALSPSELISPGTLIEIGAASLSTGGAVANTGLALHRLGFPVRLLGKVGADTLGGATLDVLRREGERLADGMIVSESDASSYTLVISLPGVDRAFLHCPGANHTFSAADVSNVVLENAGWLHFGYPPLMQRMYEENGAELRGLFSRARSNGVVTSLDMSHIDPSSAAGAVDWKVWLANVLPDVDVFLPSIDETLAMLRRKVARNGAAFSVDLLRAICDELFHLGATVVGLKLGEQGLYLRSSPNAGDRIGVGVVGWSDAEVFVPCFQVVESGTTGAGDCTIAGFIAAMREGASPEKAATMAVAVGAASVEAPDATSGVPTWAALRKRIDAGWARRN